MSADTAIELEPDFASALLAIHATCARASASVSQQRRRDGPLPRIRSTSLRDAGQARLTIPREHEVERVRDFVEVTAAFDHTSAVQRSRRHVHFAPSHLNVDKTGIFGARVEKTSTTGFPDTPPRSLFEPQRRSTT